MNLPNLLKEYLVTECGFSDWQVELRFEREVVVYLSGRKLHFIVHEDQYINCCLMRGGMSTPNNADYIMETVIPSLDFKDPESFPILWDKMNCFLPRNRVHHEASRGAFSFRTNS